MTSEVLLSSEDEFLSTDRTGRLANDDGVSTAVVMVGGVGDKLGPLAVIWLCSEHPIELLKSD